jgi:hypothetical protein
MKFCIVVMALKVTSMIPKWLSVCPPLITFEPLGRFSRNFVRRNDIQGDIDAIIFNPIASIMLKILMFIVVT